MVSTDIGRKSSIISRDIFKSFIESPSTWKQKHIMHSTFTFWYVSIRCTGHVYTTLNVSMESTLYLKSLMLILCSYFIRYYTIPYEQIFYRHLLKLLMRYIEYIINFVIKKDIMLRKKNVVNKYFFSRDMSQSVKLLYLVEPCAVWQVEVRIR